MDIIKSLLHEFQEYIIELLKITLYAGTSLIIDILNSTINAGVTYLLRGLEHSLIFIVTCLSRILKYCIEILMDYGIDLLSIIVRLSISIIIYTIGLLLETSYQVYVNILLEYEYITEYDITNDDYNQD